MASSHDVKLVLRLDNSFFKLAVPADGSCPKVRLLVGGVRVLHVYPGRPRVTVSRVGDVVSHGYPRRAGVAVNGMSAVVGGAPTGVA
jgi:hypothetical protein